MSALQSNNVENVNTHSSNSILQQSYSRRLLKEVLIILFVLIPAIATTGGITAYLYLSQNLTCNLYTLPYPFEELNIQSMVTPSSWKSSLDMIRGTIDHYCTYSEEKLKLFNYPPLLNNQSYSKKNENFMFLSGPDSHFSQEARECMISVRMISFMASFAPCYGLDWGKVKGYLDIDKAYELYFEKDFSELLPVIKKYASKPKNYVLCRKPCETAMLIYQFHIFNSLEKKNERQERSSCSNLPESGDCVMPNYFLRERTGKETP